MNTRLEETDLQSTASAYAVQGSTSEQNEWGRLVGYKRGYNDAYDQAEQRIAELEATIADRDKLIGLMAEAGGKIEAELKRKDEALRYIAERDYTNTYCELVEIAEIAEQALKP